MGRLKRVIQKAVLSASLLAPPLSSFAQSSTSQGEPMVVTQKTVDPALKQKFEELISTLDSHLQTLRDEPEKFKKGKGLPDEITMVIRDAKREWEMTGKLSKLSPVSQRLYQTYLDDLKEYATPAQNVYFEDVTPVRGDMATAPRQVTNPFLRQAQRPLGQVRELTPDYTPGIFAAGQLTDTQMKRFKPLVQNFIVAILEEKGAAKAGKALADFIKKEGLNLGSLDRAADIAALERGEFPKDTQSQLSAELTSSFANLIKSLRIRVPSSGAELSTRVGLKLGDVKGYALVADFGAVIRGISLREGRFDVSGDVQKGYDVSIDASRSDFGTQFEVRGGAGLEVSKARKAYADITLQRDPTADAVRFLATFGFSDEKGANFGSFVVYSNPYLTLAGDVNNDRVSFGKSITMDVGIRESVLFGRIGDWNMLALASVELSVMSRPDAMYNYLRARAGPMAAKDGLQLKVYGIAGTPSRIPGLEDSRKLRMGTTLGAGASMTLLDLNQTTFSLNNVEAGIEGVVYSVEAKDILGKDLSESIPSVMLFFRTDLGTKEIK